MLSPQIHNQKTFFSKIIRDSQKTVWFLVAVLSVAFWMMIQSGSVYAATGINKQISFQGKVVNANGTNVANGNYDFIFKIYTVSSGGAAVWTETRTAGNQVTVTDGIFQVDLGSVTALPGSIDFNTDNIYLGIEFNSDGEMLPRVHFTAAPYAFNALKVAGLTVTDTTGTLTIPNSETISFGGSFTTSASNDVTLTTSGATNVTLPTTGTLATLAGTEEFTNKTIGSTGLTFSGATTDLTTASGEDLTLVGAGGGVIVLNDSVTSGALTISGASTDITTGANEDLTFTANGSGDYVFNVDSGTFISVTGTTDGQAALTIAAGDLTLTDGDLIVTAGDANFTLDAGDTFNISKTGASAGDVANITASSVNAIDGFQIALTSTADTASDNVTGLDIAWTESTDADVWTAINIPNTTSTNSTTQGLVIGTGYDTGISVVSGGISITAGTLAVNSDSITSDGTLVINASGTVDVQDTLNADNITTDTGGVSIAASQSYTGAGAVTLSSATASDLTINSGTTGTINIGTDASAETINIGNTGAAVKTIAIGNNTQANTITIGDASVTGLSLTDNNWSVTAAGAASFTSLSSAGTITFSGLNNAGAVLFTNSSGVVTQDTTNFIWDDTNNRLGIGDATPDAALDFDFTSTNGTNGTEYGAYFTMTDTGVVTSGTDTTYGTRTDVSRTGATGGTINTYGTYTSLTNTRPSGAGSITGYGSYITATGSTVGTSDLYGINVITTGADNNYGIKSAVTATGGFSVGIMAAVTDTAITTASNYGGSISNSDTGIVTSGSDETFGLDITTTRTGATGGTIDSYGLNLSLTTDNAGSGTATGYGINLNTGTAGSTNADTVYGIKVATEANASTTAYGLYVDSGAAAGTEYAAVFLNGNVGIGESAPTALLTVGTGGLFQVTSSGAIAASAGITTVGTTLINTTGTAATTIGNATGTFALTSSGGLNVTTGGALTGVASIDTIATSATALTFAGAGTITSTTTSALTLDSGTTGTVNIGTGTAGKAINIGTDNTTSDTITIGSLLDNVAITSDSWNITDAGVLTVVSCSGCGGGGATLDSAYTAGNTIGTDSGSNVVINLADVATPTEMTINNLDASGTNALQIDNSTTLTNALFVEQSAAGTLTNALHIAGTAGTITTGLLIADGAGVITNGIQLTGTFTTALLDSPSLDITGAGAITGATGVSTTTLTASGAIAADGESITFDGATLVINGGGAVDIQDSLNADSITSDAGVSIATGNAYTGAGTVTLSSAAASDLTINSGTTGTINIGTDASAETINIGNTGAAVKVIAIGNNTQANTITIGDASVTGLSLVDNNWSVTTAGLITTSGGLNVTAGDVALVDNTGTTWSITNAGVANFGASVTIAGAGDGTDALILTLGDIAVTNGDLDVTAGDFNVGLDAADTLNISKTGASAGDVMNITASSVNAIDGLQLALTSTADAAPDNLTGIDLAFTESTDADVWTAINLPNTTSTNSTTQGLIIGTGYDVGISVVSGGVSITAGALAVNSDSITSDGTLVINASGTVDVDDILNANSITSDAGVSIAAGSSYTGAGAVTLSSAAGANNLTIDSGSTGSVLIGTGVAAKTITIGNATDDTFSLNSSGLNVTSGGALTGVASIDTIAASATGLTFAGAGTITSTTSSALTLDSGTTGTVNLATGNNAKTLNIATGTAGNTVNIGTDNTTSDTINIGSALDNVAITGDQWNVTNAGVLTVVSCSGCGGGGSIWSSIGAPTGALSLSFDAGETSSFAFNGFTTETGFALSSDAGITSGELMDLTVSAASAFTGNVLDIGLSDGTGASSNTGNLLKITNAGTANANTSLLINHYATGTGNLALRVNDVSGDTTPFVIDGNGNVGLGDATPDAYLDIDYAQTSGTILNIENTGGTVTLTGNLTGANFDFSDVNSSDNSLTGLYMIMPSPTNTGSGSYLNYGMYIQGGATAQTTAAGMSFSVGMNIATPDITQTTGTAEAMGLRVAMGNITTGGTQTGVSINANFVEYTSGTVYGLALSGTNAGAASETAIEVGAGWDTYLNTASIDITGAGAITGATGVSTTTVTASSTIAANGGITLAASQSLTASALAYMDLGSIVHNTTAVQGLRLPQAASVSPSSPTSGEGYLAWDAAGNQLITYNGSAWTTVGGGSSDLQTTYGNDADGSNATISLTAADDGLVFTNPTSGGNNLSTFLLSLTQQHTTDAIVVLDMVQSSNAANGVNLTANAIDGETGLAITANGLTSGKGISVASSATAFTGNLVDVSLTGSNAANTGNVLAVSNTGTASANTALFVDHRATGTGNLALRVNDESSDTTPFIVDGDGRVGIGTASVTGSAERLLQVGSSTNRGNSVTYGEVVTKGYRDITALTNIKDIYVYDTSADSDGGRWIDWATTDKLSWYTETIDDSPSDPCNIATDDRCYTESFPRKAVLIVTTDALYIFDAATNDMWMKFSQGTNAALGADTNNDPSSVTALNGVIYVGTNGSSAGGLYVFDFVNDRMYNYDGTDRSGADVGIGSRNGTVTYNSDNNTNFDIATVGTVADWVKINDVSVATLQMSATAIATTTGPNNGTTVVGLATDSGLTVINLSTQKVFQYSDATDNDYNAVAVTRTGRLYALNEALGQAEMWINIDNENIASRVNGTPDKLWDETSAPLLSKSAPTIIASAPDALEVVERGSLADGGLVATAAAANSSDLLYIGTNQGLTEIHNHATAASGWSKFFNTTRQTPLMPATIRRVHTMDDASGDVTNAAKSDVLVPKGSPTYGVNGVRGKAMSFNGTSQYLCSGSAGTCATSANDAINTGSFAFTTWFKHATTAAGVDTLFALCYNTTPAAATGCIAAAMNASGQMVFTFDDDALWSIGAATNNDATYTTTQTFNDNQWHFLTFSKPAGNTAAVATIDGKVISYATAVNHTTLSGSQILGVGSDCSTGAACGTGGNFWDGSIDDFTYNACGSAACATDGLGTTSQLAAGFARRLYNDARPTLNKKTISVTDATTATSTTIGDSGEAWIPNEFSGQMVTLTGGTGSGETRRVVSNTVTVLTVSPAFSTTPDTTTDFKVDPEALYGATNSVTSVGITGEAPIGEARMFCVGTNDGSDGGGVTCYNHQAGPNIVADYFHGDSEQMDDSSTEWTGTDYDDIQSIDFSGRALVMGSMAHFWSETQDVRLGQGLDYLANKLFDIRSQLLALGTTTLAGHIGMEVGFTGGADLAERYYSNESLQAGEVVAIDSSLEAGVKKTTGRYQRDTIGIVATEPGIVLGPEAENDFPIALVGRVPVKVTNENGPIYVGDRVTSAARPGYAMRATQAGRVLGTALADAVDWAVCEGEDPMNHDAVLCTTVMVFVNLTDYYGQPVELAMAEKTESIGLAIPTGADETGFGNDGVVLKLATAQLTREERIMSFLKTVRDERTKMSVAPSEVFTDRVAASTEIITPRLIVDEILAKSIKADSIEGLSIWTNQIASLSAKYAGLTAEASTGAPVEAPMATEKTLLNLEQFAVGTFTARFDASILGKLSVTGALQVIDAAEFQGKTTFANLVSFLSDTVFKGGVAFEKAPTFGVDTAGFATIEKGRKKVRVNFTEAYEKQPIVTVALTRDTSPLLDDQADSDLRADVATVEKEFAKSVFENNVRYIVTEKDRHGFTILLAEDAPADLSFSWVAIAVKGAKTFESGKAEEPKVDVPTDVPVDISPPPITPPVITPTPEVTPLPEPIQPLPEEIPVVTPSEEAVTTVPESGTI